MALFGALVLGYARNGALRAAFTLVAVAVGVASLFAIDLANATAVASFARSVNVLSPRVNLQIVGAGRGFDERTLLRVQRIPGVRSAEPTIAGEISIGRSTGPFAGTVLNTIGVDITRAALPPGAAIAASSHFNLGQFIDESGVLVSDRLAAREGLHLGSRFKAWADGAPVHLRVMGLIPAHRVGIDAYVAFVDIATAQRIFHEVGRLDRIDLVVDPARLREVRSLLARVLPPGAQAIAPKTRQDQVDRMLASFQMNLAALAYVALLVGGFLIYNAVAISVVQRRNDVGTLRALGASRMQILRVFLGEGALYGAIGSALGLALGALLARYAVAAVQTTVSTLYIGSHADGVRFSLALAVKAYLVGVAIAVTSAAIPAFEASRTQPALAMRERGVSERGLGRLLPISTAAAVVLLVAAWLSSRLPAVGSGIPLFGYLAGALCIAGIAALAPAGVLLASLLLRAFAGERAVPGLAVGFLRGSPRRYAVAVATLATAVGMMLSIGILVASFRTTVAQWAYSALPADLYVTPIGGNDASSRGGFPGSVARKISALPGVRAVDSIRGFSVVVRGDLAELGATNLASFTNRRKLPFIDGPSPQRLGELMHGRDAVAISEPFAVHFGMHVGDTFHLDTPSGRVALRVVALYNDYSTGGGTFMMDESTFRRLYKDDTLDSLAVYARPGVPLGRLRSRIVEAMLPLRAQVESNRELRGFALGVFDRTFAITGALYAIGTLVTILGTIGTLVALVIERRREIALARYLGLTRAGVVRSVLLQALAIGAIASVLGTALGLLLGRDLIFVINKQSFGWLIGWNAPGELVLQSMVLVIVIALVAALYPAKLAADIRTLEALRVE
ncbi:MAG: FtsX-like permease family protein [Candidatus Eremiobacteraeota bacterium]|nr:FtsX-like permease family protein [Candidatus Eremiobacteraeota bacterium]